MRLTRAVFSGYRKLDNINIRLSNVTILIGENNAGKSTLLEGISGAVLKNGMQNSSKFFSKVSKKDALVRVFFKIQEQDLDEIFHDLDMKPTEGDRKLIYMNTN